MGYAIAFMMGMSMVLAIEIMALCLYKISRIRKQNHVMTDSEIYDNIIIY